MRVRIFGVLPLVAVALMFVSTASEMRADVIFSNFGQGQTYVGNKWWDVGSAPGAPEQAVAFSFTPTEAATLTGVDLALAGMSASISPLSVSIASSSGGAPGAILSTLTQSGSYSEYPTTTVVNFACGGSCSTLNAGTQYWIVGQQTDPANLAIWLYSFGDTGTWYFNNANSATGPWSAATAGNNFSAFDVTGDPAAASGTSGVGTPGPAPEIGSLALLGTALLGIAAATRRTAWRR